MHKDRGKDVTRDGFRLGKRANARLLASPIARIDSLEDRLAAIERLSLADLMTLDWPGHASQIGL